MVTRIDLVEDVLPISELRLRAAQQITKIQETQRPLVITQYGKAVAVLMEVGQFQNWQDRLFHLEEKTVELEQQLAEAKRRAPQNREKAKKKTDTTSSEAPEEAEAIDHP
ncbi:MAG: type II toxin-antitoxin system Phd/YefM family antitoxin [Chloroflexota bacterium]|nr:type II toxin-antitoxin system Phd/YefM family antitoxin [Chloroflexota bacterium]